VIKDLKLHLDDRGYLYEMLRNDDSIFSGFGQAYVSAINPGVIKGFHKHSIQSDHVVCVHGQIKLVLIREFDCPLTIQEFHLSPLSPKLIVIPPETWHGWMNVGTEQALVINFSTHPFNRESPDESKIDPDNNPWGYDWKVKNK
jgi:dTDP-4-dehydrorhamnose 3,5-epimerase